MIDTTTTTTGSVGQLHRRALAAVCVVGAGAR